MGRAQKYVDSEVLRLCAPYIPLDSGTLKNSGTLHTRIGTGEVVYQTLYARRWYYEPANFHGRPLRGNRWFDRMLNRGGRMSIFAGIARITGGTGK